MNFTRGCSTRRMLAPLALVLWVSCGGAGECLRVMTYNTWVGFSRKQTLDRAAEWLGTQDVDVLALQELKGFSEQQLKTAAARWGHPHATLFGREGGFPQGLTSRTAIEVFDPIQPHEDARLRGTLHCRTAGIHFFVVHFNPRNTLKRRLEAAAVIERAGPLIEAGLPVIVLGDFNAVSPADEKALLTKTNLLEKWRMKEREQSSFRVFREDSRLDFTVMQLLLEAGLVDPAQEPKGTFPTRILAPGEPATLHEAMLHRIDYILTAANLTPRNPRTHYPRTPLLDELSDHYPVLLELDRTVPATP